MSREIDEGLDIVARAHAEGGFPVRDGDGPLMRAWQKQRGASSTPQPPPTPAELIEKIACIVDYEQTKRWVTASMGLARLRELYEMIDPAELPNDENNWSAFAAKHIPLPPERVRELIGLMVHSGGLIRCSKCSSASVSACGCGAPYVSTHRWAAEAAKIETAFDRAAAAIAAHPEKSNRTIAAEINVSPDTVNRARRKSKIADRHRSPDRSAKAETEA